MIGDPISQVQAPRLLNGVFAELGTPAVLVPVHIPADSLNSILPGMLRIANLDGVLVTVPHKAAVCGHADRVSATVDVAGSANALRREPDGAWYAENFDGTGFVGGLAAAGHSARGDDVTLVGAGGAGSGIAAALLGAGAARIRVFDVHRARLHRLINRLETHWPGRAVGTGRPDLTTADLAINATPLGLHPHDPLPFDPRELPPGALVADIVMDPHETALLSTAAASGRRIHHGRHMLQHQLAAYRAFFGLDETGG
ncbi:shikimate dehydrogenase family protein [Micromonospora sp. DT31]|uniref:shikimate dehydrogenase family protein n=1 Tax=Micromonospora sp. DT31 TaxID=3393434 RepID=UPI003CE8A367